MDKIAINLNKRINESISTKDLYSLRLAALLHDVGHGPFSHVTENIYGKTEEMESIIEKINNNYGVTPKPHELLSYLIITSNSFKNWFNKNIKQSKF